MIKIFPSARPVHVTGVTLYEAVTAVGSPIWKVVLAVQEWASVMETVYIRISHVTEQNNK